VSERIQNGSGQDAWTLPLDLHYRFQELCALSITGELTAEEWARLSEHLVHCSACQETKRQYERVVATVMPVLAAEFAADSENVSAAGSWSIEEAEAALMKSLRNEPAPSHDDSILRSRTCPWTKTWRYAMAAMILLVWSFAAYRTGIFRERESHTAAAPAQSIAPNTSTLADPPETAATPAPETKTAPEAGQAARLRNQARLDQRELAKLNDRVDELESELAKRSEDLDRGLEDRADLNRQLAEAKANAQSLAARLNLIGDQSSHDAAQSLALKGQVNDLNRALEEKDKQIAHEQEILLHDSDIRNLIGARNLYIAEIYDIAKTGDTQKPFGRIFYTRDKSLIFYGYDLDRQRGVRKDSAFQAWGRRGADQKHDISLGLLYQDDAIKRRWILKFNDAKAIAGIDAVFVTVEPEGGSAQPSGKPLLFTYLRLDPNHP
jgi:hypothetical protein